MVIQFLKRLFQIIIKKDKGEKIDFIGNRKKFIIGSMIAICLSVLILIVNTFVRGDALNYGIDFKGGTQIQIEMRDLDGLDIVAVRSAIENLDYRRVTVINVATGVGAEARNEYLIRMETESGLSPDAVKQLENTLKQEITDPETNESFLYRFRVSPAGDTVTLQFHDEVSEESIRAVFDKVEGVQIAATEDAVSRPGRGEQHRWRISLEGIGARLRQELNRELGGLVPQTGEDQFLEFQAEEVFSDEDLMKALDGAGYEAGQNVEIYMTVRASQIHGEERFHDLLREAGVPLREGVGGVVPVGEPAERRWRLLISARRDEVDKGVLANLEQADVERVDSLRINAFGAVKDVISVTSVGGKVGRRLRYDGIMSVLITLGLILVYIGLRFDLKYAPGAVAALAHDVMITTGIFALAWRTFNLEIIAALLTIVGYSLNDTIVVFDRIRENVGRLRDRAFSKVVNTSINETLSRTVLTSLTTLMVVVVILVLARGVIWDFALALAIGILVGTYSSVFIASPVVIWLHERFETREGRSKSREAGKKKGKAKSKAKATT